MGPRRSKATQALGAVALLLVVLVMCAVGAQIVIRAIHYARVGQAPDSGMEEAVDRLLPATRAVARDALPRCPELDDASHVDALLGGGQPSPAMTSPLARAPGVVAVRVTCFVRESDGVALGRSFARLRRGDGRLPDGTRDAWQIDWTPFRGSDLDAPSESVHWSPDDLDLWELTVTRPAEGFDGWVEVVVLMRRRG